jgi:hypothetical protein
MKNPFWKGRKFMVVSLKLTPDNKLTSQLKHNYLLELIQVTTRDKFLRNQVEHRTFYQGE